MITNRKGEQDMVYYKRKKFQGALAMLIVVAILLAGTFAWFNFSQQALNIFTGESVPDVNLHDDHEDDDRNKDVYVENSGTSPLFVRVRFSEVLHLIESNEFIPPGVSQRNDFENWHTHIFGETTGPGADIRNHYTWIYGRDADPLDPDRGRKYYLPAPFDYRSIWVERPDGSREQVRDPREVMHYTHGNGDRIEARVPAMHYGRPTMRTAWEAIAAPGYAAVDARLVTMGVATPADATPEQRAEAVRYVRVALYDQSANKTSPIELYEKIRLLLETTIPAGDTASAEIAAELSNPTFTILPTTTYGDLLDVLYERRGTPAADARYNRFTLANGFGYFDKVYTVANPVSGPFNDGAHLINPEIVWVPVERTMQTREHSVTRGADTVTTGVITMAEWEALPSGERYGPFWVADTDPNGGGWFYWAEALQPGQATGLLLSEVVLNETNRPSGSWWYGIDVQLEALTYDSLELWINEEATYLDWSGRVVLADEIVTMTDEAKYFMSGISRSFVFDFDTTNSANHVLHTFFSNGDNTFRWAEPNGTFSRIFFYDGPTPPANRGDLFGSRNSHPFSIGESFTMDVPVNSTTTRADVVFTIVDAGLHYGQDGYPLHNSGFYEARNGRRYLKLSYNHPSGTNNPRTAWLAVGSEGKFHAPNAGKVTDGTLIWTLDPTDPDLRPGINIDDRTTEEVPIREVILRNGDVVTISTGALTDTVSEWMFLGNDGANAVLISRNVVSESVTAWSGAGLTAFNNTSLQTLARIHHRSTSPGAITPTMPTVENAFDYFANNSRRVARGSSGTAVAWWLRDESNSAFNGVVIATGAILGNDAMPPGGAGIRIMVSVNAQNLKDYLEAADRAAWANSPPA